MPPTRHDWGWWDNMTGWLLDPHPVRSTIPAHTAEEVVILITSAAERHVEAPSGWLSRRWATMTHNERIAWVGRRRAALIVVWVRGGDQGFEGLGRRLSEALREIDY